MLLFFSPLPRSNEKRCTFKCSWHSVDMTVSPTGQGKLTFTCSFEMCFPDKKSNEFYKALELCWLSYGKKCNFSFGSHWELPPMKSNQFQLLKPKMPCLSCSPGLWGPQPSHPGSGRPHHGLHPGGQDHRVPVWASEEVPEGWRPVCEEDGSCLCGETSWHQCPDGGGPGLPRLSKRSHCWLKSHGTCQTDGQFFSTSVLFS